MGEACAGRDGQRSRVYAWENRVIAPHDPSSVAFGAAQGMVDAIWAESGLRYPPEVSALPRQSRTLMADASRLRIRLPPVMSSWCLLHELAHAMTSTADGHSDRHGAAFMGIYIGLLARYLRLDPAMLAHSAMDDGISVDSRATPVFLDP